MSQADEDKSTFTPLCVSIASPSSEPSREFKVNLNHPNPKNFNYAYPKEQGNHVNP